MRQDHRPLQPRRSGSGDPKAFAGGKRSQNDILLVIDVDCFKEFNDRYGHDCGDSVLTYMGQNLRGIFRRDDILCRWGGDEFLLYLFDAASHKEQIEERCRHLREAMKEYQYEGRTLSVTLSIGAPLWQSGLWRRRLNWRIRRCTP